MTPAFFCFSEKMRLHFTRFLSKSTLIKKFRGKILLETAKMTQSLFAEEHKLLDKLLIKEAKLCAMMAKQKFSEDEADLIFKITQRIFVPNLLLKKINLDAFGYFL